jgi:hypothetical protein
MEKLTEKETEGRWEGTTSLANYWPRDGVIQEHA